MTIEIKWDTTSQWNNPHFSTLYSQPIEFTDDEIAYRKVLEFFVSDQGFYCNPCYKLIVKVVSYRYSEKESVRYYSLGEFVDTVDHEIACENIKRYAQYVVDGYQETWTLRHCPGFESIEDVDDNFNPIPLKEVT